MKTMRSILFISALFATFLAVGMEKAPPVPQAVDSSCSFVQVNEKPRLMLSYHDPVRGLASAPCGNAQPRLGTVAG